jgi:outer membrane protein assembly factor BamA
VSDELGRPSVDVYFCVQEGPRTLLDEAGFEGAREVSTAELARASRLELGAPLRYRDLEVARVALTDFYRERAFAFARVDPVLERSPDHTRARVRFVVREGPRVRVGAIHVRGNERTAEALIRQRLALAEGDWYLLSAVRTSQRRVGELGVFTGVTIALEEPDVEAPVKSVAVYLVERRPQALETRGGFSTGQGLRAGFEYGYNNLLGRAVGLSLRAEVGYLVEIPGVTPAFPTGINPSTTERVQYRASGSVTFPYVPYLGPDFATSVDLASEARITTDSVSYAYRLVTNGGSLSLLNRTVRGLNLTLTGELQNAALTLFGPLAGAGRDGFLQRYADSCAALTDSTQASACQVRLAMLQQVRFPEGDNLLGAVRLGAVFDRRDSAFNPTRGGYLSSTVEFLRSLTRPATPGAPFPTTLHAEARAAGYLPILRWLVLAASARGGYNLQLVDPSSTHPTRQFLLGGADSMRGWIQNSMVPQDRADQAQNEAREDARRAILSVLGGDVYVNLRAELRASTGWPSDAWALSFALFSDLGNDPAAVDLLGLRFSPGAGVRFNTPFAVIALDLGLNPFFRELLGEQPYTIQFALGVF